MKVYLTQRKLFLLVFIHILEVIQGHFLLGCPVY